MNVEAALAAAYSIDPIHERMLLAALLDDGSAEKRWCTLREEIDLDTFWDGRALNFLPLVYRALVDRGAPFTNKKSSFPSNRTNASSSPACATGLAPGTICRAVPQRSTGRPCPATSFASRASTSPTFTGASAANTGAHNINPTSSAHFILKNGAVDERLSSGVTAQILRRHPRDFKQCFARQKRLVRSD